MNNIKNNLEKYNSSTIVLMIALVSFMGWCSENIFIGITKGFMNNRNMYFPFLLGYGLIIIVLYAVIGTPDTLIFSGKIKDRRKKYFLYFLLMFVIVSVCEIILGTTVEKLCGFVYWNYNNIPLHFTKFTSVPTSTGFALFITFFMGKCFTPIMDHLAMIPEKISTPLAIALGVIMLLDFGFSFFKMYIKHEKNQIWKIMLMIIPRKGGRGQTP
ncbi:MAG: putative ABC transporter permease [Eubacteriales bacterium]|nr:putative ABC transporter permease [Eubacteriales bacterium]